MREQERWQAAADAAQRAAATTPAEVERLRGRMLGLSQVSPCAITEGGHLDPCWCKPIPADDDRRLAVAEALLNCFQSFFEGDCRLDHNGSCQAHMGEDDGCTVADAREWLDGSDPWADAVDLDQPHSNFRCADRPATTEGDPS